MELNGKKFESFRNLADKFDQECIDREEECEMCKFGERGESGFKCFANWLDKYFEADQPKDEEKQWDYEWKRRRKMAEYLETKGFTKEQARGITVITCDFVIKPEEQIEKETEKAKKEAADTIKKMFGDGSLLESIGKSFKAGFDAIMKDKEEDHDE